METKELSIHQHELLKTALPPEAISPHPTKTYLSTIKAIYVIERFNDVFGVGRWHLDSQVIDPGEKMVVVESTFTVPVYGIKLSAFGGNDNTDRGDAYKGAVTDAVTKIGSYLGIGMDVFKGLTDKKDVPPKEGPNTPTLKPATPAVTAARQMIKPRVINPIPNATT